MHDTKSPKVNSVIKHTLYKTHKSQKGLHRTLQLVCPINYRGAKSEKKMQVYFVSFCTSFMPAFFGGKQYDFYTITYMHWQGGDMETTLNYDIFMYWLDFEGTFLCFNIFFDSALELNLSFKLFYGKIVKESLYASWICYNSILIAPFMHTNMSPIFYFFCILFLQKKLLNLINFHCWLDILI